ncbi:SpoIID/LytB domain-containing protein [Rossellomorea sp. NS-SX7]|uniref:SpoIID/LytB domain-containing protein n=1 Tax=Rossellomorea sp. NS-SX7 TaxID=3463856 RepID=UPI004058CD95
MEYVRKVKGALIFVFAMALFLIVPSGTSASGPGLITVKLSNHLGSLSTINFEASGSYTIESDGYKIDSNESYKLKSVNNKLLLYKNSTLIKEYVDTINLVPEDYNNQTYITIAESKKYDRSLSYLGEMKFTVESGKYVRPYNTLFIEDYIKGVVGFEMYPTWHIEALKAQTLAARTYAMSYVDEPGRIITDTQGSQVYAGIPFGDVYNNSRKAVEQTRAEVITYNGGRWISALYSSSNGGQMLSNTNYWNTDNDYHAYLTTKEDPYDRFNGNPYNSWNFSLEKEQIDLTPYDLTKPSNWFDQVTEKTTFGSNVSGALTTAPYEDDYGFTNYDLKIVEVNGLDLVHTNISPDEYLKGKVTITYMLKNSLTNEIRMSNGEVARYKREFTFPMTKFRTMFGTSIFKSININKVEDKQTNLMITGSGFGHSVGMSQHGAQNMAANFGKTYDEIVKHYYVGTEIMKTQYIPAKVSNAEIFVDKTSPQEKGASIKVSGSATGGHEKLYKFWVKEGSEWKVLRNYSTQDYVNWAPKEAGEYTLNVHVKDRYSVNAYDSYKTLNYVISDSEKVVIDQFNLSPETTTSTGNQVTMSAQASGGNDLQYKFWVYNKDKGTWLMVQDYSANNQIQWKAQEAGNYQLVVHVKSANSTKSYDAYQAKDYKVTPPEKVEISSFNLTPATGTTTGNTVTMQASATGADNLQYKFWVYNKDKGTWLKVQDYSSNSQVQWQASEAGNYQLVVHVKSANSTKSYDAYQAKDYKVSQPEKVEISSFNLTPATGTTTGNTVTMQASATGADNLQYKFWVYNKDKGTWLKVQDYASNSQVQWQASEAGNYQLVVHVKSANSTKSYDAYQAKDYKVSQPEKVEISSFNLTPATGTTTGNTVTMQASATGADNLQYKFWVYNKDKGTWLKVQDYASNSQVQWKASEAGNYQLVVHVKSANSTKSYDAYQAKDYKVTQSEKVEISSFNLTPAAGTTTGNTVTMQASATGADLQYKFWVYNKDKGTWLKVQDYASNNQVQWKASEAGNYQLIVHVKRANSTKSYDVYEAKEYWVK